MKRLLIIFLIIITSNSTVFADEPLYNTDNLVLYTVNGKYGLKDKNNKIVVNAKYKKLIRLGENAWIVQHKNKFGLIDCKGHYLIQPKYTHVERVFNKWVKLGNEKDFGLYDDKGNVVIPPEFTSIDPLFGGKFLTYKNYKYGIYSNKGKLLAENIYDFIYMPNPKTTRILYGNKWYEFEKISEEEMLQLPDDVVKIKVDNENFKLTNIFINTGVGTGYTVITATDYLLKIFSSISPAYEATIDDLMLSQGADTVSILVKLGWIPKFPFVYAKKYANTLFTPNKSPLSDIRIDLKDQIK